MAELMNLVVTILIACVILWALKKFVKIAIVNTVAYVVSAIIIIILILRLLGIM